MGRYANWLVLARVIWLGERVILAKQLFRLFEHFGMGAWESEVDPLDGDWVFVGNVLDSLAHSAVGS